MPKLDYPKILTNKDWQAKKSALDKVGKNKSTGLKGFLEALEKLYNTTAFAKPSGPSAAATFDLVRFDSERKKVLQHWDGERKKVVNQLDVTRSKIDDVIKLLGANSASGKHLAKMKQASLDFQRKDLPHHIHLAERAVIDAFKANLKKSQAYIGFVETDGQPGKKNVTPYKASLDKVKSVNDIDRFFNPGGENSNPPGRALSTLCQNWDQIIVSDFPDYSAKFFPRDAMQGVFRKNKWLYELSTMGNGASMAAVDKLEAAIKKGAAEADVVKKFKAEASKSVAEAGKFLTAYFKMIDQMQSDLAKL